MTADTAPVRLCLKCSAENPASNACCSRCGSPVSPGAALERSAGRWAKGLCIFALVIGILELVLTPLAIIAPGVKPGAALPLVFDGLFTTAVAWWGFRCRTPALLLLTTKTAAGAAVIVVSLGAAPVPRGVESSVYAGASIGASVGAFLVVLLFLVGLSRCAKAEGRTREVLGSFLLCFAAIVTFLSTAALFRDNFAYNMRVVGIVTILFAALAGRALGMTDPGWSIPRKALPFAIAAGGGLALGWSVSEFRLLIVHFVGPAVLEEQPGLSGLSVADRLIFLVILAPVGEEILFRGAIQGALRRSWGVPTAVLTTSILFGLMHLQPMALPYLVTIGLALALLREHTGSLAPCILLHGLYNGVVLFT